MAPGKNVTYREFKAAVDELKEDIRDIRENHLAHLQAKIDRLVIGVIILSLLTGGQVTLTVLKTAGVLP